MAGGNTVRSVRENSPRRAPGGLSYMLHYLSLLMPSAGATIWLQCVTKPTFLGKESTSPVKVVNCHQQRQSTKSVWIGKC